MSFEDTELIKEFVVESQEHLSDVEEKLLAMEEQGDNIDVSVVNTVFRAVHSIKGAAGFMGLNTLEKLAHRGEEVLNKLRSKEIRPTSDVINALLRATDRIKFLLDSIETSNELDISDQLKMLGEILDCEEPSSLSQSFDGGAKQLPETQRKALDIQLSEEALREFLEECIENTDQLEQDLLAIEEHCDDDTIINRIFRSIHTIKGSSGFVGYTELESLAHAAEDLLVLIRDGKLQFHKSMSHVLLKCIDVIRSMIKALESKDSSLALDGMELIASLRLLQQEKPAPRNKPLGPSDLASEHHTPTASPETEIEKGEIPMVTSIVPTVSSASSVPVLPSSSKSDAVATQNKAVPDTNLQESSIRVDVSILDKLMTCVGELVLARNQILQHSNRSSDGGLQASAQRLNIITSELQEHVMKTRMQPIGNVWSKFPRLVRDLAVICGKQVRIEMEGKETELDKTIIEAVKDPLTHLVRNTVDHGIETPQARIQKGKSPEGCLYLRAYHEGGLVNIEIADDGSGLDLDRIRAKALERNLVSPDVLAKMSDRDVAQLIFVPGFSTAEKVSNVSGRGVGMDVVKTNIEKIGGSVDLQTQRHIGTTIRIKIPLTLAIIPAIIVLDNQRRYAIPQVNLVELVRLEGHDEVQKVEWIQGAPVYRLRGKLLPLVFLNEALRTGASETNANLESLNIVVLKAEDRQFGLVVDRIIDSEEIVVKPLSKQLKGLTAYSGTTIMGDGKVALILDVIGLAKSSSVLSSNPETNGVEMQDKNSNNGSNSQTLLVVDVNESERCAIPLSQITRLEKLDPRRIEVSNHQEVIQYRNCILPLMRLDRVLGTGGSYREDTEIDVIVYTTDERSVGLVVHQVVDITETVVKVEKKSTQIGRTGSMILLDQVTELLDLPGLLSLAN
ncbi:MAG: chemotaxis protein CheA [Pirellula sp.]|jgi:two-component system chemotaxis sensor kinase CheA|nr:chemotaxis protein CheA [Pirellula sp.]